MRLRDRPEFANKPKPLTFRADDSVADAVARMSELNYGSVIVANDAGSIVGLVTERDILKRLVNAGRDAQTTKLSDIMTRNVHVAHADDDMLDWMRMMSNERFRRLPIVDEDNRPIAMMTQGDFVAYTWPELLSQAKEITKNTVSRNYNLVIIIAGILLYTLFIVFILRAI